MGATVPRRALVGIGVALVALLVACAGDDGPSPYEPANEWLGEIPAGATLISQEEFRRLYGRGELVIALVDDEQTQAELRDAAFLAARDELAGLDSHSEVLADLLDAALDLERDEGAIAADLGETGTRSLLGIADQVSAAVEAFELSQDVVNARSDYSLSYSFLADELRAALPTPEQLAGADLVTVLAALADLNALLATVPDLDGVRFVPGGLGAPGVDSTLSAMQLQANGDQDEECAPPTGLVANYWYPLRNFVSPIKNQGDRGVCWAFALLGAVESRELVQDYRFTNLSEQFLVNQVKYLWDRSDYSEGYSMVSAVKGARDNRYGLPPESAWIYNRSPHRASTDEGLAAHFTGACTDYTGGFCSETSHQSDFYCAQSPNSSGRLVNYCGYAVSTYSGPSTPGSLLAQVWRSGQSFELHKLRNYLTNGHVILAGMTVYRGFNTPAANGIVTDYTRLCDVGGSATKKCGAHAVQIVGFLSNEDLADALGPANYGGGGLFIVKNSWGCDYGDGGYVYVPADYVEQVFTDLRVLEFNDRRSSQWRVEQEQPGLHEGPVVTLRDHSEDADLRVPIDLAHFFRVTHSSISSVDLRVHSSISGVIYAGNFVFRYPGLGQPTLPITFTAAGTHDVTITAIYAGRSSHATFSLAVVNTPPAITLVTSGSPQQSTPFTITANIVDPNETDSAGLCSRVNWTVSNSGVVSGSGCLITVTWPVQGTVSVTATTRDSEGLMGITSRTFTVGPPPPDPNPVIRSITLYSQDLQLPPGPTPNCILNIVQAGSSIDLRDTACNFGGPEIRRYRVWMNIDNPSGETLSYSWRLYSTLGAVESLIVSSTTTEPEWRLRSPGNTNVTTRSCRVEVTVNAPDPSRSKTQTAWSGTCTYWATFVG